MADEMLVQVVWCAVLNNTWCRPSVYWAQPKGQLLSHWLLQLSSLMIMLSTQSLQRDVLNQQHRRQRIFTAVWTTRPTDTNVNNESEVIFAFLLLLLLLLREREAVSAPLQFAIYRSRAHIGSAHRDNATYAVQIANNSFTYALLRSTNASRRRSGHSISQYPHGNVRDRCRECQSRGAVALQRIARVQPISSTRFIR